MWSLVTSRSSTWSALQDVHPVTGLRRLWSTICRVALTDQYRTTIGFVLCLLFCNHHFFDTGLIYSGGDGSCLSGKDLATLSQKHLAGKTTHTKYIYLTVQRQQFPHSELFIRLQYTIAEQPLVCLLFTWNRMSAIYEKSDVEYIRRSWPGQASSTVARPLCSRIQLRSSN